MSSSSSLTYSPFNLTSDFFALLARSPSPFSLEADQKTERAETTTSQLDIHFIKKLLSKCQDVSDLQILAAESGITLEKLEIFYRLLRPPAKKVAVLTFSTYELIEWNELRKLMENGTANGEQLERYAELENFRKICDKELLSKIKPI